MWGSDHPEKVKDKSKASKSGKAKRKKKDELSNSDAEMPSKGKPKKTKTEKKITSSREEDNSPIPASMSIIHKKSSRPIKSSSENTEDEYGAERRSNKKGMKRE